MKTTSTLFLGILLIFFSCNKAVSQEKHEIILSVDTAKFSIENMDGTCSFGQSEDICNECYTIGVEKGDTVKWIGKSTSSGEDRVEITKIEYNNGTNLFKKNTLRGSNGEVEGTILQGQEDQYIKYDIYFKVYRGGTDLGEFSIDPKIKIILRNFRD